MAAGQGNKIEWTDYNAIQSVIAPVLGATATASTNFGYGQTVASSQVTQYAKITNTQWGNLRTDILRARQHQTGTDLTSTLTVPYFETTVTETAINTNLLTTSSTSQLAVNCPVIFVGTSLLGNVVAGVTYYVKTVESPTTFTISSTVGGNAFALITGIGSMICRFGGIKITEADRAAYKAAADSASTNRLIGTTGSTAIPATQSTRETLYNDSYINAWNGVLTNTITIQFTSYDAARYYFNARGQIEMSSSRTAGAGGLKNATWTTMLDKTTGMGTIYFSYNTTINFLPNGNRGTGTAATSVGFYQLTTANQLVFERLAPSGAYADNKFRIYAKLTDGTGGAGSNSCVQFTIEWRDDSPSPNQLTYGPFGPFGVDENIDGVIGCIVETLRPTGNNVSLPIPATGIANNFVVTPQGTNNISYTITGDVSTTNEGTTITYSIVTTNVPNGTVVYWTNSGSAQASDFVDGVNTGSITINSNAATLTRSVSNDVLTEGPENVQIVLRRDSTSGALLASSSVISINDTSLTGISYTVVVDPTTTTVNEVTVFTFNVTTQNFGNGTLYWSLSGTATGADFDDGRSTGSVPITTPTGSVTGTGSFTRPILRDLFTEGTETVSFQVRTGSVTGPIVATVGPINITDSSTTIPPSYTFSSPQYFGGTGLATVDKIPEGTTYRIFVDTNAQVPSSLIYWIITGGLTKEDLSAQSLQGTLPITPGSRSTLEFFARADNLTENTETGSINFYSDPGYSQALPGATGSTRAIEITDNSQNLVISPTSLTQPTSGSLYSASFTATQGSGIYSYSVTAGALPRGTTMDGSGNLTGSVTTAGPYSFTITARDSNNALGNRAYSGTIAANETVAGPTGTLKQTDLWYVFITNAVANDTFKISINGGGYGVDFQCNEQGRFQGSYTQSAGTYTYTLLFAATGHTRTLTVTTTKVVCTAMNDEYGFGSFRNSIWLSYAKDNLTPAHEVGYHAIFLPLVEYAYKSGTSKPKLVVKNILEHIARHRSVDLRAEMRNRKRDTFGRIYRAILEPLCYAVGSIIIAINKLKK